MEKELGRIKKAEGVDLIVRIDEYKGKKGVTIREFVTSEKYTGWTKSGTRIPAEKFPEFREMINSIKLDDLKEETREKVEKKETKGKTKEQETKETEEEFL